MSSVKYHRCVSVCRVSRVCVVDPILINATESAIQVSHLCPPATNIRLRLHFAWQRMYAKRSSYFEWHGNTLHLRRFRGDWMTQVVEYVSTRWCEKKTLALTNPLDLEYFIEGIVHS